MQSGKPLFWLLALSLIAVLLLTCQRLPPVVASHFDSAGVPNGWSSRTGYALLLLAVGIAVPLSTVALIRAVTRRGPERLNIPAKAYWTRPENAPEAVRRVRGYMWWLAGILAGTALLIHGLVLAAHRSDPPRLDGGLLVISLGVVTLALAGWTFGFYRLLRPPKP